MNNIIEQLSLHYKDIPNNIEKSRELDYFERFFEKYSIKNPISLFDSKIINLFVAYYSSVNVFPFKETVDMVQELDSFFENITSEKFDILCYLSRLICSSKMVDSLVEFDKNKSKTKVIKKFIIDSLKENSDNFDCISEYAKQNKKELFHFYNTIIDYLFMGKNTFHSFVILCDLRNCDIDSDFLGLISEIIDYKKKLKKRYGIMKSITNCVTNCVTNCDYDKFLDVNVEFLKHTYDCGKITSTLDVINKHYEFLLNDYKKQVRNNNKLKGNYELLIKKLNVCIKQDEIVNISELLDLANKLDIDIYEELLRAIAMHNRTYYSKLEHDYNAIKSKSGIEYIDIFSKYGLSFTSFTKEQQEAIMNININEIDKIISLLISFGISINLFNIIINTNSKILDSLLSYIKIGVIDTKFIQNNIDICYDDKYNLFINNLKNINDFGINVLKLASNPKILLCDTSIILNNLDMISKYGINITSRNIENYEFLSDSNLVNKIDLIIELNLENILLNNPEILNYDINVFKRVRVAQNVNCDYLDGNDFNDIILNKFFIDDYNIDSYLNNSVDYFLNSDVSFSDKLIDLDKYSISNLSYSFNGVTISKNKVFRNMEGLNFNNEMLFKSIIKNSILSYDEIDSIKSAFVSNVKKI